mmetsp:Transcript_16203/g.39813  ORF Transcript_16203/g.39813 Transcript_16203/m.39813 type:complete len:228 (+) Transcript_16203:203-886(+)
MCLVHGFDPTFKLNDNVGGFVHRDEDYNFDRDHHQMTTRMPLCCSAIENSPNSSNISGNRNGKTTDGKSLNNPSSNNMILFSTSPTSVMDVMSCLPSTTAETAAKAATITVNSITHGKFSISSNQQKRHRRSKYRLTHCDSHMKSCPFLLAVYSEGDDQQGMDVRNRNHISIIRKPKSKIHRRCHAIVDFSDAMCLGDLQPQSQQSNSQELPPPPERRCFCCTAKSA